MVRLDRRQFLAGTGTAAGVGLAGCLGGGGGGGSSSLKIGLLAPFSGGYGFYGNGQQRGMRLAFEQINESDEILPNTELELVTGDTKTDPEVGLSAARDLALNEQVDHLTGATSSAVANTVRNFVATRDMTFTIVSASSPFLTQDEDCNRKTFRTHNHSGIFSEAGADWATNKLGTEVYLLYQDYSFGYTVRDNVIKGVEGAGGEVIAQAAKPLGANQYGGVIDEIMDLEPDWVSMNMAGTGGLPFFTQAASRGLSIPCSGTIPPTEMGTLTPEQFEKLPDIYYDATPYHQIFDNETNQSFLEAFEERYDQEAVVADEAGYTPGLFVGHMIDEAGGGDASLDDVIAAGEGLSFDSPKGQIDIRECDHQGASPVRPMQLTGVGNESAEWEILATIDGKEFQEPCEELGCQF